jgi:hypothetical protein
VSIPEFYGLNVTPPRIVVRWKDQPNGRFLGLLEELPSEGIEVTFVRTLSF